MEIRPLATDDEARACAAMMAATDPWITLGRDYEACLRIVRDDSRERYVAIIDGEVAGLTVINLRGALVGYIHVVCVDAKHRGRGIGAALVGFAEQRVFRDFPNLFLCVSSFNTGARRLYERLGFDTIGTIPNYVKDGYDEILMRKTIASIDGFRR